MIYDEEEVRERTDWREGRRVVELGVLAEGLAACAFCFVPLHLRDCVDIYDFGLASVLHIPCSSCKEINKVPTGKRHGRVWDVNT